MIETQEKVDTTDFEYAISQLKEFIQKNYLPVHNTAMTKAISIFEDIVQNSKDSSYFKTIAPANIKSVKHTQVRAVTQQSHIIEKLKNEINKNGLKKPLFVHQTAYSGSSEVELLDGTHRFDAINKSMTEDITKLGTDYKCNVFCISYNEFLQIESAIKDIQIHMNHAETKIGNNKNDIMKVITSHVNQHKIDLSEKANRDNIENYVMLLDKKKTLKGARNIVSRIKKTIASRNSDINQTSKDERVEQFVKYAKLKKLDDLKGKLVYSGFINGDEFNGCLEYITPYGSTFDQKLPRDMRWLRDNKGQKQAVLFQADRSEGSATTVIESRVKFFELCYEIFVEFGPKHVYFDYVIITPQFKQDFLLEEFCGDSYDIKAENVHTLRIVSKQDMLNVFANKKAYDTSWIFTGTKSV